MLSLHTVRAQIDFVQLKPKMLFWVLTVLCTLGLWASLALLFSVNWHSNEFWNLSLFSLVATVQITLLVAAHLAKYSRVENFYRSLSTVRAREERRIAQYVESYRHLREHSNAYAIIVLELILAAALAITHTTWERILIILLWLVPPAYCWAIATMLEVRFAENPDKIA
jgi:hypothetical protein